MISQLFKFCIDHILSKHTIGTFQCPLTCKIRTNLYVSKNKRWRNWFGIWYVARTLLLPDAYTIACADLGFVFLTCPCCVSNWFAEKERERKLVGPLKNSCGHDFPISSWIGGRGGDKVILSKFLSVAIVFGFPHWKLFWMDAIYDISIMYQIRFLSASSLYFVRFSFYRHICSQNKLDLQSSYVLILCQAPLEPNDRHEDQKSRAFRHWFLLFYHLHTTRFIL